MNIFKKTLSLTILTALFVIIGGCQENNTKKTPENRIDNSSSHTQTVARANTNKKPTPRILLASDEHAEPAEGPMIKFNKLEHDFGVMGPNTSKEAEFKFKNVGNETLIFSGNPQSTCGCTVPKLSKMRYEPGESGEIKVRFNSGKVKGKVRKYIHVTTNDAKDKSINLAITANIELAIQANTEMFELKFFEENAGITPIVISAKDGQKFSIKSFTSTDSTITADIDYDKKAVKHTINPKVDQDKLKKRLSGNIQITVDHPHTKQFVLRYYAKEIIQPSSRQITLLDAKPDEPVMREIMLISNYNMDFQIESIESKKNHIEVISRKKIGKNEKLQLKVTPPQPRPGLPMFNDYLTIKIKDGPQIRIDALGIFKNVKPRTKPAVKTSN